MSKPATNPISEAVSAIRSDIADLRSIAKRLDVLSEDYGGRVGLFLHEAALLAARGAVMLSECLPGKKAAQ